MHSCCYTNAVILFNTVKSLKFDLQYCSFITSLLHACTRMAPRNIWRVKLHGLPWKIFFHKTSRGIFMTRVLAIPRHVTFPQDMVFHVTSHGIYKQCAWLWSSILLSVNKPTRNNIMVIRVAICSLVK